MFYRLILVIREFFLGRPSRTEIEAMELDLVETCCCQGKCAKLVVKGKNKP